MSTTKPTTDYPNLRQLLGRNFYKYTFYKDITDDEIQALKQFPLTNRQENFKRHQLLEELIETNMFTMEVVKKNGRKILIYSRFTE